MNTSVEGVNRYTIKSRPSYENMTAALNKLFSLDQSKPTTTEPIGDPYLKNLSDISNLDKDFLLLITNNLWNYGTRDSYTKNRSKHKKLRKKLILKEKCYLNLSTDDSIDFIVSGRKKTITTTKTKTPDKKVLLKDDITHGDKFVNSVLTESRNAIFEGTE